MYVCVRVRLHVCAQQKKNNNNFFLNVEAYESEDDLVVSTGNASSSSSICSSRNQWVWESLWGWLVEDSVIPLRQAWAALGSLWAVELWRENERKMIHNGEAGLESSPAVRVIFLLVTRHLTKPPEERRVSPSSQGI